MKQRFRLVAGILIFIISCALIMFAVWRYTGFALPLKSFRISATSFHVIILVSIGLIYAQWKICPEVWLGIRQWFCNHIWSIMFCIAIMIIFQALLFCRFYERDARFYKRLKSDMYDISYEVDNLKEKIEMLDEIKQSIDDIDGGMKKLKQAIESARTIHEEPRQPAAFQRYY